MKLRTLIIAGMTVMTLMLTGCVDGVNGNNDELVLKAGFSTGSADPRVEATKLFKDKVEEATDGRIKVEIYADGELGSDSELIASILSKDVDITASSAGNFASYVPEMGVSAFPFLFEDFDDAWDFVDGDIQSDIEKGLSDYNIKVLGHYDNGFRCVTTSAAKGAVENLDDMSGLKIRTPENQIVMQTMLALNAQPQVLEFTKLYDALANDEFDAQENPIPVIYNNNLYEVQANLAITNHSYDTMPFVLRQDIWDSLSGSDQKILLDAAIEAQKLNRDLVKSQTEDYVKKLEEKGMNITHPNLNEFREATSSLYESFAATYGSDLIEQIKK